MSVRPAQGLCIDPDTKQTQNSPQDLETVQIRSRLICGRPRIGRQYKLKSYRFAHILNDQAGGDQIVEEYEEVAEKVTNSKD